MDEALEDRISAPGHSPATRVSVLCLAWATTLHVYTSAKTVHFAVHVPRKAGGRDQVQSIRIPINGERAIKDMLLDIRQELGSLCDTHQTSDPDLSGCEYPSLLTFTVDDGHNVLAGREGYSVPSSWVQLQGTLTQANDIEIRGRNDGQDLISQWQARCMMDQFIYAAGQIHQNAANGSLACALSTCPKHVLLLQRWKDARVPLEVNQCVHHPIEVQFRQQPHAPAVAAWDLHLTYHELDVHSAALARRLRSLDIGPEAFVPLLFERSGWTIVAALGVLRAGAAFALLEPSFPDERLHGMCTDMSATVGICSSRQSHRMTGLLQTHLVLPECLDDSIPQLTTPLSLVDSQNAAYVAFTSGSTGQPKGAVIEHRAICTSSLSFGRLYQFTAETRMLQGASYAFDASLMEILAPLMRGGCVCVPSESERRRDIMAAIDNLRATVMVTTPSLLRLVDPAQIPPSLHTLIMAGEPITRADLQTWGASVHLGAAYGPAECAVCTTGRADLVMDSDPANIGPPAEALCWIVDREDSSRLAPVGALGELVIEGPIVGRGYIGRPEQTKRAFHTQPPSWRIPFGPPNHRLYWTGDLARWQADGSLRIAGRKDDQVKLHGQRIELGEIERTIRDCLPAIRDVVVNIVSPVGRQAPILVSFIHGPEQDPAPEGESMSLFVPAPLPAAFTAARQTICTHLRKHLPPFMIPTLCIPLIRPAPLTVNGKTDRRRLTEQAAQLGPHELRLYNLGAPSRPRAAGPPRTGFLGQLQQLVATVLGGLPEQVPLDASFLDLGGDSWTAMKLCSLARTVDINIDVVDLLAGESLMDIRNTRSPNEAMKSSVCYLSQGLVSEDRFRHAPKGSIEQVFPATELQEFFRNLPFEYFQYTLHGDLDVDRLAAACQALVERHQMLRTVLDRDQKHQQLFQIILAQHDCPLETHMCNDDGSVQREVESVIQHLCAKQSDGLHLGDGGVRFMLVTARHPGKQHVLVIHLAHTHYDGVSVGILWDDLVSLYEQKTPMTPAISFCQYRAYCESHVTNQSLDFWRRALKDSSMTYVNGQEMTATPDLLVTRRQTIPLAQPPQGITLATVVKAAWAVALSRHQMQDDIVFGQVVSGRSIALAGVDSVIGPCMNTIPVRVRVDHSSEMRVIEFLQQIQSQHFDSLRYETTDFSTVRDQCTDWPRSTQFGSVVLHQNMLPRQAIQLGQATGTMTAFYPEETTNEFLIYSTPSLDGRLTIQLTTSRAILDQTLADSLTSDICRCILAMIVRPDELLEKVRDLGEEDNCIS